MNNEITQINGINVILSDMPESNTTTILILVKAGSIYETKSNNGISHFLEHMFFKGGKKYNNAMKVAEALDNIGGEFNAYTGDEYAGYYVKSAPEYLNISMDVLSDMLVNATFPKEELEREKGVIIQEIMMYEDMPQRLVMDKWKNYYYGDNSYGWSTLGKVDTINNFTQDDFFSHKNSLYTKDNLIIIVAGNLGNINQLKQLIGEKFNNLNTKKTLEKPIYPNYLPEKHEDFYDKKTEQNHLVIGAKGFSIFEDERFAANLLGTILGGNMSSRLFQEIREKKGLCYYIGGNHYSSDNDGLFVIRAGIEKGRFEYGVKEIYNEIEKIVNGDLKKDEFNKSLGYMKGKTKMGIESSDQMAEFIGEQYLLTGTIKTLQEILGKYEKVEINDINNVAKKLTKDNLFMYYIQ